MLVFHLLLLCLKATHLKIGNNKTVLHFLSSDLNRLGNTNGLSLPQGENALICPPTSGHLMAEKMRLGRQDQGDTDNGETWNTYRVLHESLYGNF